MAKIDFDKINEYGKKLGVAAKGKTKSEFANEVLDAIVTQYEENESSLSAEDFEKYKGEENDMLQFYMENQEYAGEGPGEEEAVEGETGSETEKEESGGEEEVEEEKPDKKAEVAKKKAEKAEAAKKAEAEKAEKKAEAAKKKADKEVEKATEKKVEKGTKKRVSRIAIFAEVFKESKDSKPLEELVNICNLRYAKLTGTDNVYQAEKVVIQCLKTLECFGVVEKIDGKYEMVK